MVSGALNLVSPVIYAITIAITSTSAAYVARQKTTEYNQVKGLLVSVHLLYIALVSLEVVRYFYSTPSFMAVYTVGNTTFVLLDVLLLTIVALIIYYRPRGTGLGKIISELIKRRRQRLFLVLFSSYIVVAEILLLVFRPFAVIRIPNLVGSVVLAQIFTGVYLDVLLGVLLVFIVYPSSLLFLASRRTTDREVSRALVLLPVSWIGIGLVILIFDGYLLTVARIDASAIGYLVAASLFSVSASVFRRATLLSGFFSLPGTPVLEPPEVVGRPFSSRIGIDPQRVEGKTMLLEVDPAMAYEQIVRDLSLEFVSTGHAVFAFVTKGGPIYSVLSSLAPIRFFVFTDKVSYPRAGNEQNELLVPRNDQSVLLSVLDKALTANRTVPTLIIFDGLTDMILTSGLESAYKFIKQANELLAISKTTALFVLTESAQGVKETNVVRSLFNDRLAFGTSGLHLTKTSQDVLT